MNEKDFLDKIDCNFPYNNRKKWKELVNISISISDNCVYGILEEVTRIPFGEEVQQKNIVEILDYVFNYFDSPLVRIIMKSCYDIAKGKELTINETIDLMKKIKLYKHSYIALNIIYFGCNDSDGIIEMEYNDIINFWNNK